MSDEAEVAHDETGSAEPDDVSQLAYAEAIVELEAILEVVESADVDVDVLVTQVRRAAALLRCCRERIDGARFELEQIVVCLDGAPDDDSPQDGAV